jgi:CheY-like chemotaxis protein
MPDIPPIEILLIEDNAGDARLAREALREARVNNRLTWLADGVEALAYLRQECNYAGARRPDLILLDLNIPRKDGREVLAAIKSDAQLRRIPVVILTSSREERDIVDSYRLGVNSYITKPVDFERLLGKIQALLGGPAGP